MPRQFYRVVTQPMPEMAQHLLRELAPFAISRKRGEARSPDILTMYAVDEHTMLNILIDYQIVYSKLIVPEQPIDIVPQQHIKAVMMVNPPLAVDLGDSFYEHTVDGTFSMMGQFEDEVSRIIAGTNEVLVFEFYRLLNLGLVRPSPRNRSDCELF